jgi:hypothetical protein
MQGSKGCVLGVLLGQGKPLYKNHEKIAQPYRAFQGLYLTKIPLTAV